MDSGDPFHSFLFPLEPRRSYNVSLNQLYARPFRMLIPPLLLLLLLHKYGLALSEISIIKLTLTRHRTKACVCWERETTTFVYSRLL